MDKKNKYWQLFLSTFKLSACTFGGGFVIIPLMRERFVKELHWIEEEETLDLTAIAQSSPGSIAINASILMGYHMLKTVEQMSKVSGIGENKLRELMDSGELEYIQNGNRRLIADAAIWDWYHRAKKTAKPPARQGG